MLLKNGFQNKGERMEGRYLKQITKDAFEKIGCNEDTYFVNGCFFDERTGNLIAFELCTHRGFKYYKIERI
jgi:hypothetical protein